MPGRQNRRGELVSENMRRTVSRQVPVEALQAGKPAAEHDGIRVQHIDDRCQSASQSGFVAAQAVLGQGVACLGGRGNGCWAQGFVAERVVLPGQGRAAEKGFNAAAPAAVASGQGLVFLTW